MRKDVIQFIMGASPGKTLKIPVTHIASVTSCNPEVALIELEAQGLISLVHIPVCPVTSGFLNKYGDTAQIPSQIPCDLCDEGAHSKDDVEISLVCIKPRSF